MKIVPTIQANIFVGFREQYSGVVHTIDECIKLCRKYCDSVGLCVSITPTNYIYTNGEEPGAIIGLINYPRFPSSCGVIEEHSVNLGIILLNEFNQYRVSIIVGNKTIMLEKDINKCVN